MEHKKALVVYFSNSGNTRFIAEEIATQIKADIFEMIPIKTYPSVYRECTDLAAIEKKEHARPEIALQIDNIDNYETIYLGFPNWWSSAPMIVFVFLEKYDLSNKVIRPFITHGGGGIANCVKDIKQVMNQETSVKEALVINDTDIHNATNKIQIWLH